MEARKLRARLVYSGPGEAVRTAVFMAALPLYRRRFDRARSPADLVRLASRTVPGGPHQVPEEISGFLQFARSRDPRSVCEIGMADGGTTVLLARAGERVSTMVGIDLEVRHPRFLHGLKPSGQSLHLLEASSLEPSTVSRVETILDGTPLDVLFIDGSHVYEHVCSDFLMYRPLVREGGLIAFHDIVPDHAQRYGRPTGMVAGGVPRFWQELKEAYVSREFVRDPEQDAFGIGVIEHDSSVPLADAWTAAAGVARA